MLLTHGVKGVKKASICCLWAVPVSFSLQSQEGRAVPVYVVVVCLCVLDWVVHQMAAVVQSQTSVRSNCEL